MNKKILQGKIMCSRKASLFLMTAFIMIAVPMKAEAIGGLPQKPDSILPAESRMVADWTGVPSYAVGVINPPKAHFVKGTVQYDYYGKNNTMYYQTYGDLNWYSPVPDASNMSENGIKSYDDVYENTLPKDVKVEGLALNTLPGNSPYKGVNFKVYSVSRLNHASYNELTKGGYTFNTSGEFVNLHGEWRYMGYSRMGNSTTNPYFPPDVFGVSTIGTYRYEKYPWNNAIATPDGWSLWDNQMSNEYYKKLDAIAKLLEQEPLMKAKGWSVEKWADYLSLRTDPTREAGIFIASQGGYQYYRSIVLKAPPSDTRNLRLVSIKVTNPEGEIMGSAVRNTTDKGNNNMSSYIPEGAKLTAGSQYKLTVQVKNMSEYESVAEKSIVDVGLALGKNALSDNLNYSLYNAENKEISKSETYKAGETKTYEWIFTVPLESYASQKIRLSALINELSALCQDNTNYNDDTGSLIFDIDSGHFSLYNTVLVDKNGKEQAQPIPGEEYRVRYYAKYVGASIVEFDSKGKASYPKFDIPLNSTIYRNVPPVYNYGDVIKETITIKDTIKSGQLYKFDSKLYVFEVPVIKANATVSPAMTNVGKRAGGYTSTERTWRAYYNLSVSDVKVTPITERPYEKGYQTFAVTYTINNTAPSWLTSYDIDVNVSVALGNATPKISKVHLSKGANRNITEEVKVMIDPAVTPEATLKATVSVNFDKGVWEEDIISNMK